jgi:hypothetical protein
MAIGKRKSVREEAVWAMESAVWREMFNVG